VFGVGPARRDGAVDQAHSPLNPLPGLHRVRHNSARTALTTGTSVVTIRETVGWETPANYQELLCVIVPQIHTCDLHCPAQSACFRGGRSSFPRRGQGDRHAGDKFLYLREHQPCSTLISHRSFLGPILASVVRTRYHQERPVAFRDMPNLSNPHPESFHQKHNSLSEPLLNSFLTRSRCHSYQICHTDSIDAKRLRVSPTSPPCRQPYSGHVDD
jgi:hypothetical protein